MDKYIIQSNDNQEFELTVDQVNEYPFFKDQLKDIDIEPGTIFIIPFPADLLTLVFNNDYNQSMDLDKLVGLINLVAHLGLEDEVDKLLQTLLLYFQHKFTAIQIEMIKPIINTLNLFIIRIFLFKTIYLKLPDITYHSSYIMDEDNLYDIYAVNVRVYRASSNLDYTLIRFVFQGQDKPKIAQYAIWHKNEVVVAEIPKLTIQLVSPENISISNNGKYYELVKSNLNI